MIKISLCMIVKDEELVLARCLKCIVPCVDEIIIVDTGSKDKTKEIAKQFTNSIYDFVWINNFSKARNFAFSKATCNYVMWLDADDVIDKKNQEKLLKLKETLSENVGQVYMKYHIAFDEFGNPTFSYLRERLFKKSLNPIWREPIHEYVECGGEKFVSDIEVIHKKEKTTDSNRNLKIFKQILKNEKTLNARMQYYYARELMYHNKTKQAISAFNKFLKMNDGWSVNKVEACCEKANCYLGQNQTSKAIQSLLDCFLYEIPTPEIFCKLGEIYFLANDYKKAVYWYEQALYCKKENYLGFVQEDYYVFIPALQLCVIHYRQGNKKLAKYYNELAGKIKPQDKSYQHNKVLFEKEEKGETI